MAELIREKGSKNLVANIGYADGVEVINNFDSCYPWSGIERIIDENENVWIHIPKFYTHYVLDENNNIKERYISKYKLDDNWHLNPIFLSDTGKELAYVEIAAYLATLDGEKLYSKSGLAPTTNTPIETVRAAVQTYNTEDSEYNYSLYDIWASILEQDLFTIEFANSDSSSILQGYRYSKYERQLAVNGQTDIIPYSTGTESKYTVDGGYPMKYRGIENMTGNGCLVMDHIKIIDGIIYISYFDDNYINTGITVPQTSGNIKTLLFDKNTKLVFPNELEETRNPYGSRYTYNSLSNLKVLRGQISDSNNALFTTVLVRDTLLSKYYTYRMILRPKN